MTLKCIFWQLERRYSDAHWSHMTSVSCPLASLPSLCPLSLLYFPLTLCPSQSPRAANFFSLRLTRQRGISADGLLILSGSVHRASRSGRSWRSGAVDGDEMDSLQPNLEGADKARSSEVCARVRVCVCVCARPVLCMCTVAVLMYLFSCSLARRGQPVSVRFPSHAHLQLHLNPQSLDHAPLLPPNPSAFRIPVSRSNSHTSNEHQSNTCQTQREFSWGGNAWRRMVCGVRCAVCPPALKWTMTMPRRFRGPPPTTTETEDWLC